MTELTRFQRRLIKFQSAAFNFERASVALLSSFKEHRHLVPIPSMNSEWCDPPAFRMDGATRQGAHHG